MEIKRTTDGLRKNLCELEDISQKPAKKQNTEKQRKKKKTLNKTKQNIQELCDNYKESNIHVIRTGKEREKEKEEIFETIMTKKEKKESEVTQSCLTFVTPWTVAYQVLPGKSTGVGCHYLLCIDGQGLPIIG